MGGPIAGIVSPRSLDDRQLRVLRALIAARAEVVEGDNFWIEGRPFGVAFGDSEGALAEAIAAGLAAALGWMPGSTVSLTAMCNRPLDHRLLGETCLDFVQALGGVVDFGGQLPIGPALAGSECSPTWFERPEGIAGSLLAMAYPIEGGSFGLCHYGDARFMRSWLGAPGFGMVK